MKPAVGGPRSVDAAREVDQARRVMLRAIQPGDTLGLADGGTVTVRRIEVWRQGDGGGEERLIQAEDRARRWRGWLKPSAIVARWVHAAQPGLGQWHPDPTWEPEIDLEGEP